MYILRHAAGELIQFVENTTALLLHIQNNISIQRISIDNWIDCLCWLVNFFENLVYVKVHGLLILTKSTKKSKNKLSTETSLKRHNQAKIKKSVFLFMLFNMAILYEHVN